MRGLIILIILLVVLVGGAILLSRSVTEQPTKTIEVDVAPAPAAAQVSMTAAALRSILLAAGVAGAALAQSTPESILPPGFGDPAPPPRRRRRRRPRRRRPAPSPAERRARRARPTCRGSRISSQRDARRRGRAGRGRAAGRISRRPPPRPGDDRGAVARQRSGLPAQPWGSASGKFLSVVLRRTDGPLASRWAQIGLRNVLLAQDRGAGAGSIPPTGSPSAPGCCSSWARPMPRGCWWRRSTRDTFTPKMVQVAAQVALANSDPSGLCAIETELGQGRAADRAAGDRDVRLAGRRRRARRGRYRAGAAARPDRRRSTLRWPTRWSAPGADTARAVTIEWEPVNLLTSWRYGLSTATGDDAARAPARATPRRRSAAGWRGRRCSPRRRRWRRRGPRRRWG